MPTREVEYQLEQAMTARHIREALEGVDDDTRVFFVCNYGDHGNTQQALPISEMLESTTVENLGEICLQSIASLFS